MGDWKSKLRYLQCQGESQVQILSDCLELFRPWCHVENFWGSDLCALLHLRFLTSASLGPLRAQMRSGEIVWHLMQQGFAVVSKTEEWLLRSVWEQTVFGHS